ncbi:MAG: hypothetical protein GXP31_02250 [Kiritimatiellaeota bacterium]|nr:hypothetical protein [Kiritimatiellota bacterium]
MSQQGAAQAGRGPAEGPSGAGGHGFVRGLVVGLAGALVIWPATPYVNFVLRVGFIADGQLPTGALFLTCLLVLVLNPLARRFLPSRALSSKELAVAVGVMLVASVPASGGLLRMLVNSLAMAPTRISGDHQLAELYDKMRLPSSLFPDRMQYQAVVPASEYFLDRLPSGKSIPWSNWVPPLLSWGTFVAFSYLMMIGLGMVLFTQWRRNERLPFPLLTLQRFLIADAAPGERFAPLFKVRSFWVAAGVVFLLHFLGGANQYNPGGVPAVPLEFNIRRLFTSTPFVYLPGYISHNRIYFTFLALAFFMPNRVSVSIWFWQLAYALYTMYGKAYFPPFYPSAISHHRSGAMLALALAILWLGRAHWRRVARLVWRGGATAEDRRDSVAGRMFVVGCAGMTAWFVWTGVSVPWSVVLVAMAVMLSLVTARMVAETGLIQVWLYESQLIDFARLIPGAWYSPTALFFVGIVGVIFGNGGRVCGPAMVSQAVGLDEQATPERQRRLLWVMLPVLLAAVVICGAAYLTSSYHHATSLDGKWRPLTPWGAAQFEHSNRLLRYWDQGTLGDYAHNKFLHFGIGMALAGVCEWLCLTIPSWPIHPVGLLIVQQWHANLIWFSVFLGWLLKVLLVRYGGSRLYRAACPAVIGLIVGELLAAVFWMVVGMVLLGMGHEFRVVPVLPY